MSSTGAHRGRATRPFRVRVEVFAALVVLLTLLGVLAPVAAAGTRRSATAARQHLEQLIEGRLSQLAKLTLLVNASTTLSAQQVLVLEASLSSEQDKLQVLLTSAETAPTAALRADQRAFNRDGPSFEVASRQVKLVLSATAASADVVSSETRYASEASELKAKEALPGYASAASELLSAKSALNSASRSLKTVAQRSLALTARGYPANLTVFQALAAKVTLALSDLVTAKGDLALVNAFITGIPVTTTSSVPTTTTIGGTSGADARSATRL